MGGALATLFGTFAAALVFDIPVASALGIAAMAAILVHDIAPLPVVAQQMVAGLDSFPLLAIPLFVLAGGLMGAAGLTGRIVALALSLVGQRRGALAAVAVVACMLFGALSGSGVADVVAIGSLVLPAMRRSGYPPGFSAALLGCAGSLGTIIPPSIVMIVYGVATGTSIGQLFTAGLVPGVLAGLALMAVSVWKARREGWGGTAEAEGLVEEEGAWVGLLALGAPAIIVGGIRGGIFTATEAGAVACLYALVVGVIATRALTPALLWAELRRAAETSGVILYVIATASLFGWVLGAMGAPQVVTAWLLGLTRDPTVVILLAMALLLVLGTFMETIAVILLLAPILSSTLPRYGIDPVHFGLLLALNLAIGANTPPLGIDLMAACRVAGIPMRESFRHLPALLGAMACVLLALALMPDVVLALPRALG
ncbi:TRAP transporter large permease [Elioraea rosea]|uniref:TRAP transporter large permease n=1 Tax=Elioraea rosea TaxID=2492390 RepID=UPI001183B2D6|nr:TRAP transporter large permease [Elioraea rosea]